jgi:hypothetical protein
MLAVLLILLLLLIIAIGTSGCGRLRFRIHCFMRDRLPRARMSRKLNRNGTKNTRLRRDLKEQLVLEGHVFQLLLLHLIARALSSRMQRLQSTHLKFSVQIKALFFAPLHHVQHFLGSGISALTAR